MSELEEFRDQVVQQIEDIGADFTEADDDWMQVAILDTPEGRIIMGLHPQLFINDQSKDMLAFMIKQAIKVHEAKHYAVLFNAHMKAFKSMEEVQEAQKRSKRIQEYEGAQELLLLVYGNATFEHVISANIVRDGENPPTLTEWKPCDKSEGRFTGFNEEMRGTPVAI